MLSMLPTVLALRIHCKKHLGITVSTHAKFFARNFFYGADTLFCSQNKAPFGAFLSCATT